VRPLLPCGGCKSPKTKGRLVEHRIRIKALAKRTATIQYRYFKTSDLWEGVNLKDMVVEILRRTGRGSDRAMFQEARLRKIDLDQDGSTVLLNQLSSQETWDGPVFSGQLVHVKPGADLPGISSSLDESVASFELQNLSIGDQVQIVNGVLYFAVVGNHVGLIEDNKARGRTLERYLTRILQDSEEFEPGQTIVLNAKLEGELRKIDKLTMVPKRSASSNVSPDASEDSRAMADADGEGGSVLEVLGVLGWSASEMADLTAQLPPEGWLEGRFHVMFKQKRKRLSVDRAAFEEAIRNLSPGAIGLNGGGSEQGGLKTLSERTHIDTIGTLLDPEEAMAAIVKTLRKWSARGDVDIRFDN